MKEEFHVSSVWVDEMTSVQQRYRQSDRVPVTHEFVSVSVTQPGRIGQVVTHRESGHMIDRRLSPVDTAASR